MSGKFQATKPHPSVGRLLYEREAEREGLPKEHAHQWLEIARALAARIDGTAEGPVEPLRKLRLRGSFSLKGMASCIAEKIGEDVTAEEYEAVENGTAPAGKGWGRAIWDILTQIEVNEMVERLRNDHTCRF